VTKVIQLERMATLRNVVSLSARTRQREGRTAWSRRRCRAGLWRRGAAHSDNVNYVLAPEGKGHGKADRGSHAAWCALLARGGTRSAGPTVMPSKPGKAGGPAALRGDARITEDDEFTFEVDGTLSHGSCRPSGVIGPMRGGDLPSASALSLATWALSSSACRHRFKRGSERHAPFLRSAGQVLISMNNPAVVVRPEGDLQRAISADAAEKLL